MKVCDCLTYVRLNLEVLARNRGIMLLTALLALVFCIPVFLSVPTGADLSIWQRFHRGAEGIVGLSSLWRRL